MCPAGGGLRSSGRNRFFQNALPSELFRRVAFFAVLVRDLGFPVLRKSVVRLKLVQCCVWPRALKERLRVSNAVGRSVIGRLARKVCAQVGEWLKPTDCKSVPPSEVRRFESSPVHQRFSVNRLLVAFAAFAILA